MTPDVGTVIPINAKRRFSLGEASELLPVVRRITQETIKKAEELVSTFHGVEDSDLNRKSFETSLNGIVSRWGKKIIKLGATPKGLWLVDFDNGHGFFCWRFPETEIAHYHSYAEGFTGRKPLSELKVASKTTAPLPFS